MPERHLGFEGWMEELNDEAAEQAERKAMSERPRDEVWDALTEGFGEPRTKSERGRRNRAVGELRQANATPEEIAVAIAFCRQNFTSFSEMAVCNWLARALHEHKQKGTKDSFLRLVRKETHDRGTSAGDR